MSVPTFFAPASLLLPIDGESDTQVDRFGVTRRLWDVSIFDWAELQSRHKLQIPYTVADALLQSCNLELTVDAPDLDSATDALSALHLMLYVYGIHPFSVQMITSHSINDYSDICSRKTRHALDLLPPERRRGVVSSDVEIHAWRCPYPSGSHVRSEQLHRELPSATFVQAATSAQRWLEIRCAERECILLERVALTAPTIPAIDQSLLHIWTGLEAIFPGVQSEVSFRLAMYIAQMTRGTRSRKEIFDCARRSYGDRSKVAHGRIDKTPRMDAWDRAWGLLIMCLHSILSRGSVPSEETLIDELLRDSTPYPAE